MLEIVKNLFSGSKLPKYSVVEKSIGEDEYIQGIKITSGKYTGLIFTTSPSVEFLPQEDGNVSMKFEYLIQGYPEEMTLPSDDKLQELVGDIILDIIEKDLSKGENNAVSDDPKRSN